MSATILPFSAAVHIRCDSCDAPMQRSAATLQLCPRCKDDPGAHERALKLRGFADYLRRTPVEEWPR